MANDKITMTDATTGETIERDMTNDEQSARDDFLAGIAAEEAADKAAAEQAAINKAALLAKLGITADEFKILLGGN